MTLNVVLLTGQTVIELSFIQKYHLGDNTSSLAEWFTHYTFVDVTTWKRFRITGPLWVESINDWWTTLINDQW